MVVGISREDYSIFEGKEISPDLEVNIRSIFGENAKVEIPHPSLGQKEIEEIKVIIDNLADGNVKGGQKVTFHLSGLQQIPLQGRDQNISIPIRGFEVKRWAINDDYDITEDFGQILFVPKQEMNRVFGNIEVSDQDLQDIDLDSPEGQQLVTKMLRGNRAHAITNAFGLQIILSDRMRTTDDLIILMHENGHVKDIEDHEWQATYSKLQEDQITNPEYVNPSYRKGMISRWLYVMQREANANNSVMKTLTRGPHAQNWRDAFPDESAIGFSNVYKMLREENFNKYLNLKNGWYLKEVDHEQIPRLISPLEETTTK